MKLIEHIIIVSVGEKKHLMINSINGLMDRIDDYTLSIINIWRKREKIVPQGEVEVALYDKLNTRGYLVSNYVDEIVKKEKILQLLRERQIRVRGNKSHITFLMTYDCNFRCSYCFERIDYKDIDGSYNSEGKRSAIMTPALIDAALKLAGDNLKSVGLFGGEPLLPQNRYALEYIINKAPDKVYEITTNGYYLEEFLDLLKKIKIASVMVTLDGGEKIHNSRRFLANGGPTYEKIMVGIERCLINKIPICIRMNLDDSNFEEGNVLKEKLLSEFARYGEFLSFEISPMLGASCQERNKLFSQLHERDIEYDLEERLIKNRLLSQFSPIINTITSGAKLTPIYSFCYAHDNGYIVDPFGNIFPCLLSVGSNEFVIGKYYPQIELKRKSIRTRNIDTIEECKKCIYSLLCGGGCPIALIDSSDVFKPECFSIKNQIHNLLPIFYELEERKLSVNKGIQL